MTLILDASMALSWLLRRNDPFEATQSGQALDFVRDSGAMVPALWYSEVANALLLAERQRVIMAESTSSFLSSLSMWEIVQDSVLPALCQAQVIHLGRVYKLTGYDATYLELAMRRAAVLATFDRKLADAARAAGVRVFGDAA
ncbi:MAG: type II toxin-antitoxin system VapC family toxin [Terracidiphilus sp.]